MKLLSLIILIGVISLVHFNCGDSDNGGGDSDASTHEDGGETPDGGSSGTDAGTTDVNIPTANLRVGFSLESSNYDYKTQKLDGREEQSVVDGAVKCSVKCALNETATYFAYIDGENNYTLKVAPVSGLKANISGAVTIASGVVTFEFSGTQDILYMTNEPQELYRALLTGGTPVFIVTFVGGEGEDVTNGGFAVSKDGTKLVVLRAGLFQMGIFTMDNVPNAVPNLIKQLTVAEGASSSIYKGSSPKAISLDNQKLAIVLPVKTSGPEYEQKLYLYNMTTPDTVIAERKLGLNSGNACQMLAENEYTTVSKNPIFLPNGKIVIFGTSKECQVGSRYDTGVYLYNADLAGDATILADAKNPDGSLSAVIYDMAISPDGKKVGFISYPGFCTQDKWVYYNEIEQKAEFPFEVTQYDGACGYKANFLQFIAVQ